MSKYSPCVFADLTISKIADLIKKNDVKHIGFVGDDDTAVSFGSDTDMSTTDIQNCLNVMRVGEAKSAYGITGSGVKVGLLDLTCPSGTTFKRNPNCTSVAKDVHHANTIYSILRTIAPNATYYATGYNETRTSYYEQIEWLLSSGVNIITSSMGIDSTLNKYNDVSRWLDHIAYNYDVHFVQAAGNFGNKGVCAEGMAYNVITVGNTGWTGSYVIDGESSYNNDGANRT